MKKVIENAKKAGVDSVITPAGLVSGIEPFGILFIGEIYNVFANAYSEKQKKCDSKKINELKHNNEELKGKLPIELYLENNKVNTLKGSSDFNNNKEILLKEHLNNIIINKNKNNFLVFII